MQHIAISFHFLRRVYHSTVHYNTIHYSTMHKKSYSVLQYNTLDQSTIHKKSLQCITIQDITVQCIKNYSALQYDTLQYNTSKALRYTIQCIKNIKMHYNKMQYIAINCSFSVVHILSLVDVHSQLPATLYILNPHEWNSLSETVFRSKLRIGLFLFGCPISIIMHF